MRWLDSITNSMDMNLSKLRETVKDREAWHAAGHGLQHGLQPTRLPVHGILQARTLEWGAIASSEEYSRFIHILKNKRSFPCEKKRH